MQPSRKPTRLCLEQLELRNLLASAGSGVALPPGTYTPAQIRTAYNFPSANMPLTINNVKVSPDGSGQTIAIVNAFDDPTIYQDVAKFDQTVLGVSDDPKTFLTQVFASGSRPESNISWSGETALDVEWAHAIAPGARIVLVEASSDGWSDLQSAVSVAGNQTRVSAISMSWGGPETDPTLNIPSFDQTLKAISDKGITLVAAAGDQGSLSGVSYPSSSPYVLGVGGTSLQVDGNGNRLSETGWSLNWFQYYWYGTAVGGGGGVSAVEPEPAYQVGVQNTGYRTTPDVSYNADPATGFQVIDSQNGGAYVVGGTSAGTPQYAGLVAIANQVRQAAYGLPALTSTQTLTAVYSLQNDFNDITSGNTGRYSAQTGYDMVSGLGSPRASQLILDLAQFNVTSNVATPVGPSTPVVTKTSPTKVRAMPNLVVAPTNTLQAMPVLQNVSASPGASAALAPVALAPSLTQTAAVPVIAAVASIRFDVGTFATGGSPLVEAENLPIVGLPVEENAMPVASPAPVAAPPAEASIVRTGTDRGPLASVYSEVFSNAFADAPKAAVMVEEGDLSVSAEYGFVAAALVLSGAWQFRPKFDPKDDSRRPACVELV
jgi:hypothetical protein